MNTNDIRVNTRSLNDPAVVNAMNLMKQHGITGAQYEQWAEAEAVVDELRGEFDEHRATVAQPAPDVRNFLEQDKALCSQALNHGCDILLRAAEMLSNAKKHRATRPKITTTLVEPGPGLTDDLSAERQT